MSTSLKIALLSGSLLLAAPAFAQTDAHAGHHPATPATAPATPAAQPSPASDMPAARHAGHAGMMAGGDMMTPAMMKACMREHAKRHRRHAMHHGGH